MNPVDPNRVVARPAANLAARPVAAPKILEADLHVSLRDADGFRNRSASDVDGQVSGTVRVTPAYVLERLQGALKSDASKSIDSIRWDAQQKAYVVKGHAKLPWLPDPGFTITLKPTADGRLAIEAGSWADWLARLVGRKDTKAVLREQLAKLPGQLAVTEEGGKFVLDLVPGMSLPFGAMGAQLTVTGISHDPGDTTLGFDAEGGLVLGLRGAKVTGGTQAGVATKADAQADSAELDVKLAVRADKRVEARISGEAHATLDAEELAAMVGTHKDVLGPIGHQATVKVGELLVEGDYSDATDWRTTAKGQVDILTESGLALTGPLTATIDGKARTTRVEATDLAISHPGVARVVIPQVVTEKTPAGFDLKLTRGEEAPFNPRPATQGNKLGLLIGGQAFNDALHDVIRKAEGSVHGETFEFSPGVETRKLITTMAQRAAGLAIVDGQAVVQDAGIPVRVLTDREPHAARSWAGRSADALAGKPGGEEWAATLRQEIADGKGAYASLTQAQRAAALANLAQNLEIRDNAHPILRTDHRKVWVVDGALGMTGGINLDDPMLTTLHDVMLPTIGPVVDDLQAEWLENWREVGGVADVPAKGDPAAGAKFSSYVGSAGSEVQVLVTDDRQNEIEEGLVRAIDGAQTRIRLEHAYFTEDRVIARLEAALRRGVDLDVIVPEIPAAVFHTGNRQKLAQLVEAAKAPGAGKLNITFFQQNGDYYFHNHTKALAVDGTTLIVGSGNLDQRGLSGSFAAGGNRIMFNRELDYRITDPAFVARFEREIFDRDQTPGEGKPLAAAAAETWTQGALAAFEPYIQRFHAGKPAHEVVAAVAAELRAASEAALPAARKRALGGEPGAADANADRAALALQGSRMQALTDRLQALDAGLAADARKLPAATLSARIDAESAVIAATMPAGRIRDIAVKGMNQARDAYLKALAETPAPGYPSWFAERLTGQLALWGLRGAALPVRDRLAGLIKSAPAGTFDAEIRKTLVPDEQAAKTNETMDLLF